MAMASRGLTIRRAACGIVLCAGLVADGEAKANDGARHWAYRPPVVGALAAVDHDGGPIHPVDAFLQQGRAEAGLAANPRADRRTLIRRASYDLTGLPPTREEVEVFVADESPDAWTGLVDRLLASPQYGEKWGRFWLDAVRWAESNGYERDSTKPFMWKYRDYVVEAFNRDKPYNQFLLEQLAGDVMPDRSPESLTATGFYRLGLHDDEPADEQQYYFDTYDDIINTVSRATLATSLSCARCHDHKVDPISQKDYYRFLAFIRNLDIPHRGAIADKMVVSTLTDDEAASIRGRMEEARRVFLRARLAAWEAAVANRPAGADPPSEDSPISLRNLTYRAAQAYWPKEIPDLDQVAFVGSGHLPSDTILLPEDLTEAPGLDASPLAMVVEGALRVPAAGRLTFSVRIRGAGWMWIGDSVVFAKTDENTISGTYHVEIGAGDHPLRLVVSDRNRFGLQVDWLPPGDAEPITVAATRPFDELVKGSKAGGPAEQALATYGSLRASFESARVTAARESPEHRPTFVLLRGNPHVPGDPVAPGFPPALDWAGSPTWNPEDDRPLRWVLAQWIAGPANPLTARVAVNRIWMHHFGRGLVASSDEFGGLGSLPTHPELLDWLAAEFVRQGWRHKPMHRLLMTSAAYQRSSHPDRRALAADPLNLRYWRFDMRRLSAEEIRDSILQVSGDLDLAVGGPSVFPTLPEEVLSTASNPGQRWNLNAGPEDQRRRSLYTFVRRSLLDPQLAAFDMADTDVSCPSRFITTVPAQALAMLNGAFVDAQARRLADRLPSLPEAPVEGLVQEAFRLVLGRDAAPHEVAVSTSLLADLERDFDRDRPESVAHFALMMLNLNEFLYLD